MVLSDIPPKVLAEMDQNDAGVREFVESLTPEEFAVVFSVLFTVSDKAFIEFVGKDCIGFVRTLAKQAFVHATVSASTTDAVA